MASSAPTNGPAFRSILIDLVAKDKGSNWMLAEGGDGAGVDRTDMKSGVGSWIESYLGSNVT